MPIPPDRELVKSIPFDGVDSGEPISWWFEYDKHGSMIVWVLPDGRRYESSGIIATPVGGKLEPAKERK